MRAGSAAVRMMQPEIRDLAVIGDRNTCALLDRQGTLCWYCPERFDGSAAFSLLLDEERGGYWAVDAAQKQFSGRAYAERGSILTSHYRVADEPFAITDWMPLNEDFSGVCRRFSTAPVPVTNTIRLRADYGLATTTAELSAGATTAYIAELGLWLRCSHPLRLVADDLQFTLPAGCEGWAVLTSSKLAAHSMSAARLASSLEQTALAWREVAASFEYQGPYQDQVRDSIRVVQQLTFAATGGVVAAATTSLPEVLGGERNFDYRFVWLRDVNLVISALIALATVEQEEPGVLAFIAQAIRDNRQAQAAAFYAVDRSLVTHTRRLPLAGYRNSRPVTIGNSAHGQLQLDAHANVLFAAKLSYDRFGKREQWEAVATEADFLCRNWQRDDNGIWEERVTKPYTSSKVFAARGLEFMAEYTTDADQAQRWRRNAADIRSFVRTHCMTRSGAFAVYAGSQEVDVTAAQFPLWTYCEPQAVEMLATIAEIERHFGRDELYRRRLEEFDSREEGSFLASTCWMAHYYAVAGNVEKSRRIIEATLAYQNDLGMFSEEAGADPGAPMLGNFPQSFVHSSFVCAVNGLKFALTGKDSRVHLKPAFRAAP